MRKCTNIISISNMFAWKNRKKFRITFGRTKSFVVIKAIVNNCLTLHFFSRYAGISHTYLLISLPIFKIVELKQNEYG